MRARSSARASGPRCRRLRRWCRESRSDSICCVQDAHARRDAVTTKRRSRKKSCLFRENCESRVQEPRRSVAPLVFNQHFRAKWVATEPHTKIELADPAAGEDSVVLVDDGGLARCYGTLRRIEGDSGPHTGQGFDRGSSGFVSVPDFYRGADRCRGFGDADPVYGFDLEHAGAQGVFFADYDAIGFTFDGENVERLARGEAEALALPYGEIVNAVVAAENFARCRDQFAFAGRYGNFVLCSIGVDELYVVAVWDKAKLHAVGLLGDGKRRPARDLSNFAFRELAKGKFAMRELLLRKAPQEIGLILGGIERTQKFVALRGSIVANACIVAGGKTIGANLAGHSKQRLELYVGVAIGTGDGSAAVKVVVYKRADDALFKLVLEIDDVVRKVEMLGDSLGVVDVIERAAAVLSTGLVTLKFREPALIPELHGQTDDRTALLPQYGCDGRRVDSARHGNGDKARLDRGAGR